MLISSANDDRASPGREHQESMECPTCKKLLSSRPILIRHCRDTHQMNVHQEPINARAFPCLEPGCKSGPFKRKSQWRSHKLTKHINGPEGCVKGNSHNATNPQSFHQDAEPLYFSNLETEAQEECQKFMKIHPPATQPIDSTWDEKMAQDSFLGVSDIEDFTEENGAMMSDETLPKIHRSYSRLSHSLLDEDNPQDLFNIHFTDNKTGFPAAQNPPPLDSKLNTNRSSEMFPGLSTGIIPYVYQKGEMPASDQFSFMNNASVPKPNVYTRLRVISFHCSTSLRYTFYNLEYIVFG